MRRCRRYSPQRSAPSPNHSEASDCRLAHSFSKRLITDISTAASSETSNVSRRLAEPPTLWTCDVTDLRPPHAECLCQGDHNSLICVFFFRGTEPRPFNAPSGNPLTLAQLGLGLAKTSIHILFSLNHAIKQTGSNPHQRRTSTNSGLKITTHAH